MATPTKGSKHGLGQSRRPRTGTSSVRPRQKPVVSCQVTVPFDKKLRIAGILRGTAHSKIGAVCIEIGFPTWEEQNPITSTAVITPSVMEKLNEAGFTYDDAVEYINAQPSLQKKGKK